MSKRISHSLLDPLITPAVKPLYRLLHIPRWIPPEAIVVTGHLVAVVAAFGFAYSTSKWWGGLLVAAGVIGNHLADMVDGTHARTTNQCRNGGELLDHFTDPLSFCYWILGMAISCDQVWFGVAGILGIYATAVLTNIRAKMTGEFTLATLGPTEFKCLLAVYGLVLAGMCSGIAGLDPAWATPMATWFLRTLVVLGIAGLAVNLVRSVIVVNKVGSAPDTSDWEIRK
ncbi:MAG: CDP-alcohol phosphatidyltransferase family protein [Planctomycetes bacterium]|nr:CDP-alcohol phosphatidyltransferase family protein [Planctomycetota bacterium]NOG53045.1 CDP-alcohol phosphatidyltransferase family protein [Planctomycetota bacterium]